MNWFVRLFYEDSVVAAQKSKSTDEETENMQMGGTGEPTEFNMKTLKNKEGQFPSWLSGRQRKRLQTKYSSKKKNERKKQTKTQLGKSNKKKNKNQEKTQADQPEKMFS